MPVATRRELLEAGVHFGHQTRRWNPKMRRFIFGMRSGIYIVDLEKTLDGLNRAHEFLVDLARRNGVVLFVGTMFTPLDDRGAPGSGFTHKVGDVVSIAAPEIGTLKNEVVHCDEAEPWTFGTGALMANLARRGLLAPEVARS